MSYENSFKKCSKCNVGYDQNLGSSYSIEIGKQRRIFTKNGKHFCFSCLASEHNVNCRLCHKRINSKDELGYWGGVISVNGSYELDPNPDFFDFRCLGCSNKRFDTNRPIEDQINPKKCRIAGCSQNSYYGNLDLCKYHSKPCQGTTSYGKKCNLAIGNDEGDFCKFCKNQTETYQQQKDRLENESNRIYEQYKRAIEETQSWWNSLSDEEKKKEIHNLELRLPARIEKFWNSHGYENVSNQIEGNAEYPHWDKFENGKLYQSDTTRVPWAIVNEYFEGKRFGNSSQDNNNGDNLLPPNLPIPQSITNSNDESDNSVKVNPGSSPKPNPGKDKPSEAKNNVETIRFEKNPANPTSEKSPNKTSDNKTLIINLNNVKKISLNAEGNLVIEFKKEEQGNYSTSQTITLNQIDSSQELQKVKNYLEKNNQNSLNQQELDKLFSKSNNSYHLKNRKTNNNILLIGSIIFGTLIVGMGIALFLRRKRKFKKS